MAVLQKGQAFDKNGVPIEPGDLLRSLHFISGRRKYWLYHTAVLNPDGFFEMVPTSHLQPEKVSRGGRCWLTSDQAEKVEIIAGYGPPPERLHYTERPKRRTEG